MTRPVFCAIATDSHLALALRALRSVLAFGTPVNAALLRVGARLPVDVRDLRVLHAEDCVPPAMLAAMRARYEAAELCYALKPFLLARLLREGHSQAHYLDGDCEAYADLSPLLSDLANADLQLTPHSLSPIPNDRRTPHALTVLKAGVFNAGYVGVSNSEAGRAFIAWWASMTREYAHNASQDGMCGDQRWLDLAPALVSRLSICRRAGANVGYWNLHERRLHTSSEGFRVNDAPLLFFHFSGFDPARSSELSRHQNRHAVEAGSALATLLDAYRRGCIESAQNLYSAATPAPKTSLRSLLATMTRGRVT